MDAVRAVVDSGHRPKVVVDAGMNLGFSVTTVRTWVPYLRKNPHKWNDKPFITGI